MKRWASPDTIVPMDSQGVQALDRYAYANNSPLKYIDSSGHNVDCAVGETKCQEEVRNEKKYGGEKRWDYIKRLRAYYPNSPDWFIFDLPLAQFGFIIHEILWGNPLGWEDLQLNKGVVAQAMLMLTPSGNEGGELILPTGETNTSKGGVYIITNADGAVVRVGRTNDFLRRQGEYRRNPNYSGLDFSQIIRSDDYAVQRGMEQTLYDTYNPPMNVIRPISPKNPNAGQYFQAIIDYIFALMYR